jgi:hypothetical protein
MSVLDNASCDELGMTLKCRSWLATADQVNGLIDSHADGDDGHLLGPDAGRGAGRQKRPSQIRTGSTRAQRDGSTARSVSSSQFGSGRHVADEQHVAQLR